LFLLTLVHSLNAREEHPMSYGGPASTGGRETWGLTVQ
jgi:hypothetical protein